MLSAVSRQTYFDLIKLQLRKTILLQHQQKQCICHCGQGGQNAVKGERCLQSLDGDKGSTHLRAVAFFLCDGMR